MYDTLIIGSDFSSIVAALTSVRNGMKTALLIEGEPPLELCEGGYRFSGDPRPLSGLANQQTFSFFLQNVGIFHPSLPPISTIDPGLQVILPGHRVDIYGDREQLVNEFVREFPDQQREINDFYNAVADAGSIVEQWICESINGSPKNARKLFHRFVQFNQLLALRFSLVIRENKKNTAFKRIIEAQLKYFSHMETEHYPLPMSAAYLLSLPFRGLFYPSGGFGSLVSGLLCAYKDHGGVLYTGCSVIRMETRPEVVIDLESDGSSTTLRGKKLVVSSQWEKKEILLQERKDILNIFKRRDSIRPSAFPFFLHMGVREGGLPEKLGIYVVVVRDGIGPIADDDVVFLEISPPDDQGRVPEGRRALTAKVFLSDSPLRLNEQQLKETATRIIDSLEGFLPFLRESIDYLHVEKSIEFTRRFQEIASPRYKVKEKIIWGMTTRSSRTSLPNVLITGGVRRAGLGFEGEILSGIDTALRAER